MPKKSVGEPFDFSKKLLYRKISGRGKGYSFFLIEFFLSHGAKKFRGSGFPDSWGFKKFLHTRRVSRFSFESFQSNSADKIRAEAFCVSETFGTEQKWIREWGLFYDSPSDNFWSHFTEKLRRGPFFVRQNFSYP